MLELSARRIPHLDKLVPSTADDDGILWVRAESNARNPVGVSLLGDGELAVAEGVPELDGAVARSGDDLSVVGREGNGEDVVGVSNKASGGGTRGKLPETESLIPRGRESVCSVRGDNLYKFSASIP